MRVTLDTPMRAFRGAPLRALVQPERVSPTALTEMAERIGPALFTSIALAVDRVAADPRADRPAAGDEAAGPPRDISHSQEQAMLRLGGVAKVA